jgi:putative MATE family efflux protein
MKLQQDLTTGKIPAQLIKFGFPLLFSNLLQSLYNIVDMLIIGRIVGETGVAAISNASSIVYIINAICIGFTLGGTVLIAQYKGANNEQGQKETAGTVYSITAIISIVLTVIGVFIYKPLLSLMKVPAESMQDAREYMFVIFLGTFFVFGYNATCSILRGFGDSKSPLLFVGIATVINVILDCIFVGILNMGTVGAAYATVIAQGLSFIISIGYLKKQKFIFDFKPKSFAIKKDKMIKVIKISLPTAIQLSALNMSYLILAAMLNNYGVTIAAAAGIGLNINTFAAMPCWAVGQAVTAMVGQNIGAGLTGRAEKTTKVGLKINLLVTFICVIIVQVFAKQLIMLFEPNNPEVVNFGVLYLRICCSFGSLIYAIMYSYNSFAVGIGNVNLAMMNTLLDTVVIRLPLCFLLSEVMTNGFQGICFGQALSTIVPAIIGAAYFYSKKWKNRESMTTKI